MRKYISILVGVALATITSCEVLDMEVQENPNALSPEQFDINAYLNSIQVDLANFMTGDRTNTGAAEHAMEVMRITSMFGPLYNNAYQPQFFNYMWSTAYAGLLTDANEIIANAEESQFYDHAAIAKIIKSHMLVTLVDFWGDVPYTEALQGSENLNPSVTEGQVVYDEAMALLNSALEDLNREGSLGQPQDLYYGGDMNKWEALANSLKIRILVQTKHVNPNAGAEIAAIVANENIIDPPAEDFQFQYSTNQAAPDSRHPEFYGNYEAGADDYMSNSFMYRLYQGRTIGARDVSDPRLRYYFYRQNRNASVQTVQSLPCVAQEAPPHYAGFIFCRIAGAGYWGRDHGNNDGLPPDGLFRTIWGVYPFGGQFDANQNQRGRITSGVQGAGIQPILLSSFVFYLRAEAALTMGTGEDARALLEEGVRQNITKVMDFAEERVAEELNRVLVEDDPSTVEDEEETVRSLYTPSMETVDSYVEATLAKYDAAATPLSVVAEEYYIATFGQGIDAFNLYRRTGFPSDLQPTLEPNPGGYIYSFQYPANLVNRNSAVSQKPVDNSVRVFWDPGLTLN